jgi:sialate O-acetylesterase
MKIITTLIFTITLTAFGNIKLPSIIGDNMLMQQDTDVKIWGWATSGEEIVISPSWANQKEQTIADEQGYWSTKIKTLKASTKTYSIEIKGKNTIELQNIIFGELWLCSGQSNMAMPMKGQTNMPIKGGEEDIANSENTNIRLFKIENQLSEQPLDDVKGEWVECNRQTLPDFSAVGYYFGREINKQTSMPVGLIDCTWGGTKAQGWTRMDYMANSDSLTYFLDDYKQMEASWTQEQKQKLQRYKPSVLYNGMVAPITNMTIKGVIWYQGEGNGAQGYQYRELFPTLIKNWRCDFNNFEMPFYFVQLANHTFHNPTKEVKPYRGEPAESGWAYVREAQLMTNEMKNTGMAVAIDLGESNNIHPSNKKDVGCRLALWALAKDYGNDVSYSGPLYAGYSIENDRIRIYFKYSKNGFILKDGEPKGFAIAANDRKFIWADAEIDGETVLVYSDKIKNPVAVRYGWAMDPEISLYGKNNLPASPFRTDDWHR